MKHDVTFDNLPKAVSQLMEEVYSIKSILLNTIATIPNPSENDDEDSIMGSAEVCKLVGISKGYLYSLTGNRQIPHFKRGKRIYFDRKEIETWMRSDTRKTLQQLKEEANISVANNTKLSK